MIAANSARIVFRIALVLVAFTIADWQWVQAATFVERAPTARSLVVESDHSLSFLETFQKVRRSRRGTVIPVRSRVSPIIDHLAQVYIAPWIYARYSNVQWIIGESARNHEKARAKWKKVVDSSPVVDLFLLNHEGDDIGGLEQSSDLGWKKHQLRLLYTEGCDSASSPYFLTFLSKYNAAVAIGHRAISASPFVAFPFMRFWVYGHSALASTRLGWDVGSAEGAIADILSFNSLAHVYWHSLKDMLDSTEPGLGWTPELAPDQVFINKPALVERNTPEQRIWFVSFIRKFGKEVSTGSLDDDGACGGSPVMARDFSQSPELAAE